MKRAAILLMVLQVPLDYLMLLLAAGSSYVLRFSDWAIAVKPVLFSLGYADFMWLAAQVAVLWIVIFALSGLYTADPHKKLIGLVSKVFFACSTSLGLVALYLLFTQQEFDSRFLLATTWGFAIVYVMLGRLLLRGYKALLYRFHIGMSRVVVIGNDTIASTIVTELKAHRAYGYAVLKRFDSFDEVVAKSILKLRPDEIIFANPRATESVALECLEWAHEHHIGFQYSADLFSTFATNMTVNPLAGIPIVQVKRTRLDGWGRVVKRLFDIIGSLIFITVFSPIMLVCALIILFETGRPIIYKNRRVGERGNLFETYKFRSMYVEQSTGEGYGGDAAAKREAELIKEKNTKSGGPVYKIGEDPRVTPFGRFIRRFSLDEFPQFFNVFIGNMSLVGPRPHQPREVEQYERHHKRVLSIKPGITGLSQISGRSDLSFEDEVTLDVFYMEHWSLMLDLIILFKTPFIIFKKRKAL